MLIVLENPYFEQMAENGFNNFCVFETNSFFLKFFTQDLANGLHLRSKDQMFIIHRDNYLTFQSWLLLIGSSSNFHCALNKRQYTPSYYPHGEYDERSLSDT